jgi:hypothetical protein
VQTAIELIAGEDAAFLEPFPHGGQVGGSERLIGAIFFLAIAGASRLGPRIRTIHAYVLTCQSRMASECFINAIC